MKTNVGGIDRMMRVVMGVFLIGLTLSGQIGVWGWVGVLPLVSGLFGFCMLYRLLGINTCSSEKCAH